MNGRYSQLSSHPGTTAIEALAAIATARCLFSAYWIDGLISRQSAVGPIRVRLLPFPRLFSILKADIQGIKLVAAGEIH